MKRSRHTTATDSEVMALNGDTAAFCLDLYIASGRQLAELAELGVERRAPALPSERVTWLRVRSDVSGYVAPEQAPTDDDVTRQVPPVFADGGLAVMVQTGHDIGHGGEVIGMYHGGVSANGLARLRDALESIEWSALPRPIGGDRRSPRVTLRYSRGDLVIERTFNVHCGEFVQAIQPTWDLLERRRHSLSKYPARAIAVGVKMNRDMEHSARCVFRFEIENHGTGPVILTDPRVRSREQERPRVALRVGELMTEHHDLPPFDWTELPVPPLPEDASHSLISKPKQRFAFSVPWTASKPGKYVLRGEWRDQGGVSDPAPGQLPFMPLPERGPSALAPGPYPIRGSAFAEYRFEVTDDQAQE